MQISALNGTIQSVIHNGTCVFIVFSGGRTQRYFEYVISDWRRHPGIHSTYIVPWRLVFKFRGQRSIGCVALTRLHSWISSNYTGIVFTVHHPTYMQIPADNMYEICHQLTQQLCTIITALSFNIYARTNPSTFNILTFESTGTTQILIKIFIAKRKVLHSMYHELFISKLKWNIDSNA